MAGKRRSFGAWLKDVADIEGDTKEFLRPAIGYTSGNIMLGGAGYPISMYHQQYLTYVEGLNTEQAGRISLISGLWDAITDPIMGLITDHTRAKSGRHRRYLLIAVIPFMIAYIMRWTSFGLSDSGNISKIMLWYTAASLLYSTAFTIASVPHTSMLPMVAPKYFQRTQFLFVEYMMNSVGQVTSFILAALILSEFNVAVALGDLPNPSHADTGKYMAIGIILAFFFAWPLVYCYFHTSEPSSKDMPKKPINLKYMFHQYKMVFSNRAFRQYFLIGLCFMICRGFYNITDQYFMVSVADKYSLFISMTIVSGISEFMGTPINYIFIKKFGKQACGKILGPLMVIGLFITSFITPNTPSVVSTIIIVISSICYNFGFSGPDFFIVNIQPDVTDVDEMITGERREGVIATFYTMFRKTINSFMSYIVGAALSMFGYNPKIKHPSLQAAKTIWGLRLNFSILPTIFAIITLITIWRYRMTKNDHEMIKELIRRKREEGEIEVSEEDKRRLENISGKKWGDMWIGRPDASKVLENANA